MSMTEKYECLQNILRETSEDKIGIRWIQTNGKHTSKSWWTKEFERERELRMGYSTQARKMRNRREREEGLEGGIERKEREYERQKSRYK